MSMLKNLRIGESALLISFIRTKMGKEFDVAGRLLERFSGKQQIASYYTCYGQHDLLEFLMVYSYEAMYNVPFDKDIIDCEFGLFYSWEDISLLLHEWAHGYPALLLVFLKIQPGLEESLRFDIEKSTVNFIKKGFGDDANLFAGMGRSEILLLLRGRSFEKLLSSVSQLRQSLTVRSIVDEHLSLSCDPDVPVFMDSTTFPLIAHPVLHGGKEYDRLEGKVLPRVNVICNPGYERIVSANKPISCARASNIYGNYDVVLTWDKTIELAQFAREITDFRLALGEIGGINNTLTSFSGIKKIPDNDASIKPPPQLAGFKSELAPGTEEVVTMSNTLNPSVLDPTGRSRLLEFLGRLNSYYGRREYKSSFQDMVGVIDSIRYRLDELKVASGSKANYINTTLSEIIDLSNNGLFQRYADLETRFETSKHLPYPFLRGINGCIAAATCIPCFIFKSVYPDMAVRQNWTGFVVFGLSYSYQLLRGQILSYPANALQKPIEEWWGITHEVGHAIYWISDFYKGLPRDIKDYFNGFNTQNPMLLLGQDVEEIYANWFDFTYFFGRDKARYFPTIWKSWLRWERIKRFKFDYLMRSLIIFLTTDLGGLHNAINQGEDKDYLEARFNEMKALIAPKVPGFLEFAADMTLETLLKMAEFIDRVEHYLLYLEQEYFEKEIYDRLNPPYPQNLLSQHIQSLEKGIIIVDNIPNPIELLHALYDAYPALEKHVPLRTNAATILTLWFKYMKDYRE